MLLKIRPEDFYMLTHTLTHTHTHHTKPLAANVAVHCYCGGIAGTGTFCGAGVTSDAAEVFIHSKCSIGGAHRFSFLLDASIALNGRHGTDASPTGVVYCHALSNVGNPTIILVPGPPFFTTIPTSSPRATYAFGPWSDAKTPTACGGTFLRVAPPDD